ncbi:unnamed protein product [Sphagnum jensenii]|uniref:Uncharacterized protein n=1 Tax=Sphagnum jensenii TaxID=128206 RepID=A0ABP1BZ31_9BRYO
MEEQVAWMQQEQQQEGAWVRRRKRRRFRNSSDAAAGDDLLLLPFQWQLEDLSFLQQQQQLVHLDCSNYEHTCRKQQVDWPSAAAAASTPPVQSLQLEYSGYGASSCCSSSNSWPSYYKDHLLLQAPTKLPWSCNNKKVTVLEAAVVDDFHTFMEPTSVLDLQQQSITTTSRPSRSYSSASLSSQHSFSSSDAGSNPQRIQDAEPPPAAATAADDDDDLHFVAPAQLADQNQLLLPTVCVSDSDIASWMDCMMDPNLALLLPEFQAAEVESSGGAAAAGDSELMMMAAGCSPRPAISKLEGNHNTADMQFSGTEIEFEFETSLDKSFNGSCGAAQLSSFPNFFPVPSTGMMMMQCDDVEMQQQQQEPAMESAVAAAGVCLLEDEAPMFLVPGQILSHEVCLVPSESNLQLQQKPLQHRLTNTRAAAPVFSSQGQQLLPHSSTRDAAARSAARSCAASPAVQSPPPQAVGAGHAENLRLWQQQKQQQDEEENTGLDLVHFLLACAEAMDACDFHIARALLIRLRANSSPHGDPMKRIAFYFAEALGERLTKELVQDCATRRSSRSTSSKLQNTITSGAAATAAAPPTAVASASSRPVLDSDLAYQASYEILPFEKFAHFTGNQAILETLLHHPKLHIVDLDIRQGLQWPGLIQALAVRKLGGSSPPSLLRITAIGLDASALHRTGKRLAAFAASLQVPFEYCVVLESLENLQARNIRVEADEILAVNCSSVLHTLLSCSCKSAPEVDSRRSSAEDEDVVIPSFLSNTIRALNPAIVSLLETEANLNAPKFLTRFVEALHYYCALFDALEATTTTTACDGDARHMDSERRLQIEKFLYAPQIRDIIAHEGTDRRVRHVRSGAWTSYFTQAGFRSLAMSAYAADQAQLLVRLYQQQQTSRSSLSSSSSFSSSSSSSCSSSAAPDDDNMQQPYKLTTGSNTTPPGAITLGWQDTPVITVSSWTLC